jgi:hypothetical protein
MEDGGPRKLYSPDALIAEATKPGLDYNVPKFLRRKPPRYNGALWLDQELIQVDLDFPRPAEPEAVRELFVLGGTLAEHLQAEFGAVHPTWPSAPKGEDYNFSSYLGHFQEFGPVALCARTWLGPHVAGLLGKDALLKAGVIVRDTSWGGFEADLLDEPWLADFAKLGRQQKKVMKAFAPAGVFGDYTDTPSGMKKGERWAPVPIA